MMLSKVRGEFRDFVIDLDLDAEHPEAATVGARVQIASIDTRDVSRDGYLRSSDFLGADEYPEMVFKSTRVVRTGKTRAKLYGDLTIRDVTEPVVLDVTYLGSSKSPRGTSKVGFEAGAKINREDWDLTWNAALETGGWLVGKDITIHIAAEFAKQDETT
jgi:polyisoprenoid-binding protein YceI